MAITSGFVLGGYHWPIPNPISGSTWSAKTDLLNELRGHGLHVKRGYTEQDPQTDRAQGN